MQFLNLNQHMTAQGHVLVLGREGELRQIHSTKT